MKKTTLSALITMSLAVGITGGSVSAHEVASTGKAYEVTVTANRVNVPILDTAADVNIMTAQELADGPFQNVAQALNSLPGVSVNDSGYGAAKQTVSLQGDRRVVILVNGKRVNLAEGVAAGRATVDLQFLPPIQDIERIEIVKGGNPALYGSDAVGGVINIITKQGEDSGKVTGTATVGFGNWGQNEVGVTLSGKEKHTRFFVSSLYHHGQKVGFYNRVKGQNEFWPNSNVSKKNVNVNIDHDLGNDKAVVFNFTHFDYTGGSPYSLEWLSRNAEVSYGENNVDVTYYRNRGLEDEGFIRLYRSTYYGKNSVDTSKFGEQTTGVDIQKSFALSGENQLVSGISYRGTHMNNTAWKEKEGTYNTWDVFLQDRHQFDDGLSLIGGIRQTHNNYYGSHWSGNLGINKRIHDKGHVYATYNRIFSAPQGMDIYSGTDKNLDLKPETGYVWSYGYSYDFTESFTLGINGFYSDIKNAINWKPIQGVWKPVNYQRQTRRGVSLDMLYQISDVLSLDASYTYTHVRNATETGVLVRDNNIAPNMLKVALRYHNNRIGGELLMRHGFGLASSQYLTRSYTVLDLALRYQANEQWSAFANIFNLTNTSYASNGGLYPSNGAREYTMPAPGRNYIVGVNYKF